MCRGEEEEEEGKDLKGIADALHERGEDPQPSRLPSSSHSLKEPNINR